jgi:murein DD-endopeptidase MepM/ murein hydrolase activator NlpD
MKGWLLFLAGVLVGANVVYFVMRHASAPVAVAPPAATSPLDHVPPPAARVAGPAISAAPTTATRPPAPATIVAPASSRPAAGTLLIPVAGVLPGQLTDTFNDTRDGARRHEALDIMAARGTPVLAAADGTVAKLFTSVPGGLTIYEFDPTRTYAYYYAHLDRYAPGLAEGRTLKRGDVIAYVGSTGNASAEAPHLHFAIFVLGPEKQWWKGTAIDPYPLLAAPQ